MVRPARWSASIAVDAYGRQLACTDSLTASLDVTVAQVPRGCVPTLYARFGDWFAWLCVAGSVGAVAVAILGVI